LEKHNCFPSLPGSPLEADIYQKKSAAEIYNPDKDSKNEVFTGDNEEQMY